MDKNIRKEVEDMLLSKYESLYRLAYSYAGNEADALDVDSDIRVMETMLERDTASVEKDFGLGGFEAQGESDRQP